MLGINFWLHLESHQLESNRESITVNIIYEYKRTINQMRDQINATL